MKQDLLTQLTAFLYSIAHYIGLAIIQLVKYILPSVTALDTLAEPVGFLALITVFVILTAAARKIALIIVIAGWALILIRILLMAFKVGA